MKAFLYIIVITQLCFCCYLEAEEWPELSHAVPKPGQHPRLLFSAKDIPAIRKRANSKIGKQMVKGLKERVNYAEKFFLKNERKRLSGDQNTKKPMHYFDHTASYAASAAMLYTVTDDIKYAELGNEFLDLLLTHLGPAPTIPTPKLQRGNDELALAYDILYDKIPKAKRKKLISHIDSWLNPEAVSKMYRQKTYFMGPVKNGRPCDWGAIAAGGSVCLILAIEGDSDKTDKNALRPHLEMLKYISDYGISPEGHMPSGNGYISVDFSEFFIGLTALKRHEINLFNHPHLKNIPKWLLYETVPGSFAFDNRNQSRGHMHPTPTLLALANAYNGYANILRDLSIGPNKDAATKDPVNLLLGNFNIKASQKTDLPLTYFSSSMGTVFSRSGWNKDASSFTLTMEPPTHGHSHPDKGSFTFYAHQRALAADSGSMWFGAADHNTVLIDGKGQLKEGQGNTDAIIKTHLSSTLADLTKIDIKPAYEQTVDFSTKPKDWTELNVNNGLPFCWKKRASYDHIERYTLFIRSPNESYAVIIDDVQKDNTPHKYEWLLHSPLPGIIKNPRQIEFSSRFHGQHTESFGQKLHFTGTIPESGRYALWVLATPPPDLHQNKYYFTYKIGNLGWGHNTLKHHLQDWRWLPLTTKNNKNIWNLPKEKLTIIITSQPGSKIAQIIASPDLNMNPNTHPKFSSQKHIPFTIKVNKSTTNYITELSPALGMNCYFLRPKKSKLKLNIQSKPKDTRFTRLTATQTSVNANYVSILLPFNKKQTVPIFEFNKSSTGQATITQSDTSDYLFTKSIGTGPISSDAKFAMVRIYKGEIVGFILVDGKTLSWKKQLLVNCSQPISIINDSHSVKLKAPEGADIEFESLDASNFICNNQEITPSTRWPWKSLDLIESPVLPKSWQIKLSPDSQTVNITGNGPLPLKVHAPKAIKCVLNGISVFFSRDGKGYIYPKTGITILTHGNDPTHN